MSKSTKKIDPALSAQPGLFDATLSEGSLDILLGLKQLLSRLITASGKDRYTIAAGISRSTKRDLSKDMLDKITSADPAYQPGAVMLLAFCHEVGSLEPFSYLLDALGAGVISPEERKYLRLAQLEEKRRKLEGEINQLRAECGVR